MPAGARADGEWCVRAWHRTDGETPAFIAAVAVNTRMAHDICDDIAASWITHGQSQLLSDGKS
jgi:hypothetical protein